MKILICYISTGIYNENYEKFYNSIPRFLPGIEKKILAISDIEHKSDYHHYISHAPWPIVTLLKFWYISEALKTIDLSDITHIMYVNANARFMCKDQKFNNRFIHNLQNNDLLFSYHHGGDGGTFNDYIVGGFSIGKKDSYIELCDIHNKVTLDNLNNCYVPQFHDETVLNKIYHDGSLNKFNLHIEHYIMTDPKNELSSIYVCLRKKYGYQAILYCENTKKNRNETH